jgi:DHA3 family macrolide efflux protein-like MFS transporter
VADPVTAVPEELRAPELPREGAVALLRRHDFRRLYLAVCTSELGDAFHYIALMWFALVAGGPLGVLAVRLADSVPAFLFGFHGGLAADRWNRRRTLIAADLVRAAVLVPVAAAGLAGRLPLWGLVVAAFVLESATSYFQPAYGALLPAVAGRGNVQAANGLIQATANGLAIAGWAIAAGLVALVPVSAFFALNAASFLASAALIAGVRRARVAAETGAEPPRIREGFAALRPLPTLAAAVAVLGVAVTISSGTWIAGVPELIRGTLHHGAGGFSLVMVGYALGSIGGGALLARRPVRRKARASLLAWLLYLPGYGLIALAPTLWLVAFGALACGLGQGSAVVLLNSAAQEDVPDAVLGRVSGLISLVHRGAHATGLLFVAPLFAVVAPRSIFAAAALALPVVGLAGAAVAARMQRR